MQSVLGLLALPGTWKALAGGAVLWFSRGAMCSWVPCLVRKVFLTFMETQLCAGADRMYLLPTPQLVTLHGSLNRP